MAYTVTKAQQTVMGNQRVWQGVVTADAAEGEITFGMDKLFHVQATPKSAASSSHHFAINLDSSGAAAVGTLGISGLASGDDFYVTVWGV